MHSLPTEIETERLRLRRWRPEDLAPLAELNSDPRVMEYFPAPLTTDESAAMLQRIQQHFTQHGYGLWAVELKEQALFIGLIGLAIPRFESHFTPCVEVGWRLAADSWGQGYAPEGARAALTFAFDHLRLSEVVAMTAVANRKSRRVMEKLGMTRSEEDDFDHPLVPESHPLRRHVLYRISRSSGRSNGRGP